MDIGCGSGRDSFYFAKKGHKVFGIDRSKEAINLNKENNKKLNSNIQFYNVDLNNTTEFTKIVQAVNNVNEEEKMPVIVYLRFLLHSINEYTEEKLFSVLSEYLSFNSYVAAEFRTIEDEKRAKVYNKHYRRYINAENLLNKLQFEYSFEKIYFAKGTGFSMFLDEDPFLGRFIVKKS